MHIRNFLKKSLINKIYGLNAKKKHIAMLCIDTSFLLMKKLILLNLEDETNLLEKNKLK